MKVWQNRALCSVTDLYFKGRQRLSIMIYHRVLPSFDFLRPGEPTGAEFSWQMETVAKYFNPLSLSDALDCLDRGQLPPRAVCITFDDGYADNATYALPILQRWNIPATVFVASGYLNGGRMWNDTIIEAMRRITGDTLDLTGLNLGKYSVDTELDKLATATELLSKIKYLTLEERRGIISFFESSGPSLPNDLMLSSKQLVDLAAAGIEIGAHTKNHPVMSTLVQDQAVEEIEVNRAELESITSKPVRYFAYPNGKPGQDYRAEHRDLVQRLGFRAALSTKHGVSNELTDRYQLPRFTPWDKSPGKFLARLLLNQKQLI